ncbi:GntR family transcriptional regulator [Muricoccus nepalensis]|uniref:GntR family transcriptional regulator n=1 Tax=Muricoccus nepalensis TaxID=1854500 RepID=UPI0013871686|nr:GntR family transcriptional regulator [Roseomonas nepalensis]
MHKGPGQNRLVGVVHAGNRPRARDAAGVHEHLLAAIVDQRLPPGTRLTEADLVETFDLGRRVVGEVLHRLAWEGLVTILPNRGARVASPDAAEARAIFAARRAIEAGTAEAVARAGDPAAVAALSENLAEEGRLRAAGRLREAIRLSGGFHVLVANLSGNPILAGAVRLLVARTSLVIALFDNRGGLACWHDDHASFVELVRRRRHRAAAALMRHHLLEIERDLRLDRPRREAIDIRSALARPLA